MAEERQPPVYGLWNETMGEWFNPGTRLPYFPTREAALRLVPLALRQYSLGKWELREYPLEEETLEINDTPPQQPDQPGPRA